MKKIFLTIGFAALLIIVIMNIKWILYGIAFATVVAAVTNHIANQG